MLQLWDADADVAAMYERRVTEARAHALALETSFEEARRAWAARAHALQVALTEAMQGNAALEKELDVARQRATDAEAALAIETAARRVTYTPHTPHTPHAAPTASTRSAASNRVSAHVSGFRAVAAGTTLTTPEDEDVEAALVVGSVGPAVPETTPRSLAQHPSSRSPPRA